MSTACVSRPLKFSPKLKKEIQDPRISRPSFFRFNMEIYFLARNEASVRQFNRRFVSARSVLQSNQAVTVCLRSSRPVLLPDYCLTVLPTASSDCRLNNDKTCRSDRAVVTRLSPSIVTRLSPSSVTAWSLARLLLPGRCSVVCLPVSSLSTRTLTSSCSVFRCLPPHPTLARAVRVSRRPPVRRYQVASQIPAETQLRSIVRCSHCLASTSVAAAKARMVLWKWRLPVSWIVSVSLLIGFVKQVSCSKLISFGFNLAYG